MPSAFLSYARADLERVRPLIEAFPHDVSLWRDQENIYGGEKWPKKIGEAIDHNECFLLIWSEQSAKSYFVETEWCIAFALKKPIIPCTLDKTSLPASLKGLEKIDARDPAAALPKILVALKAGVPPVGLSDRATVLNKLDTVTAVDEKEVAAQVKTALTVFVQDNWTVGNVFQDVENLTFNLGDPNLGRDSWLNTWQARAALLSTLLGIIIALTQVWDRIVPFLDRITHSEKQELVEQSLGGIVDDETGKRLAGARITLPEFPGVAATADPHGVFRVTVKAPTGQQVHLRVEHAGYETYNLSPVLGPTILLITLQKAP